MTEQSLDDFLSLAAHELAGSSNPARHLTDVDIFTHEDDQNVDVATKPKQQTTSNKPSSTIHGGDTDSSDDEDNKYYEDRRYNESGRNIKHLLTDIPSSSQNCRTQQNITWKSKLNPKPVTPMAQPVNKPKQDVSYDPIFGLRIINPLVSGATLQDRMVGRDAVTFAKVKNFVSGNISDKNWVLGGVIVSKSPVRTSQKGSQFLIWCLSDLKDDIKTVSVFLFGNAYKALWKTATGVVVGILNPTVLEKKDNSKDEASLSIDNAQKVMILGQSKDLGTCKSVKKNGEQCNAIVNINRCEYCIYHIKQEYQKCSKRSELQSSFAGRGLTALRNKVLGKDEVFYAGRLYTAIPAKRSRKLEERNERLLNSLSGKSCSSESLKSKSLQKKPRLKAAANIEVTQRQRLRDLTLLEKLDCKRVPSTFNASHSAEATLESSKKAMTEVLTKLKDGINAKTETNECASKKISSGETATTDAPLPSSSDNGMIDLDAKIKTQVNKAKSNSQNCKINPKIVSLPVNNPTGSIPLLSGGEKGMIDLDINITRKHVNKAKLNALKFVQTKGPLKKSDPNSVRKPKQNNKRVMEALENQEPISKRAKLSESEFLSDRFKKMMEATSQHSDLLDVRDNEEQDKYFHKLEAKERMEEKMINTYKVPCKAVTCLKCKYTNFSASQFCKDNKHPLKVYDAVKRFFKCGNCGNRTQTLEIVPTTACSNCASGKWERTGMMKEKTAVVAHTLSIRGGEQKFVNSVAGDANLDLLVPSDE